MIIDTHTHYSEPPRPDRPYDPELTKTNPELIAGKFLSTEALLAVTAEAGVEKVVQVTNAKMGYDNRYSLEGAERFPDKVFGVVGRFDPFAPQLDERLRAFMSHPKMLAVRFTLLSEKTVPWLRERVLDPFLAAAEKLGVPVELFAPNQFSEMAATARRFPGVRFIIDHMGLENGPPPRSVEDVFSKWPQVITLANEPNVWMKVSFFPEAAYGSESYPFPGATEKFRQLYDIVGAARLIWGSNYPPVERVGACTYRQAVDFFRIGCTFVSPADRMAILSANIIKCCQRRY